MYLPEIFIFTRYRNTTKRGIQIFLDFINIKLSDFVTSNEQFEENMFSN